MSTDQHGSARPLPDRPNLRHLKDQAKDLLKAGRATSLADAQFQIARRYGFASWPMLKVQAESLKEIGQLKQAIDSNDIDRVKTLMTRNPALLHAREKPQAKRNPCCIQRQTAFDRFPEYLLHSHRTVLYIAIQ